MEDNDYALEDFDVGELVLSKNVNRKEPWWPVRLCVQSCKLPSESVYNSTFTS